MKLSHDHSWTLRKIFNMRRAIQPFIQSVVGDGMSIFLWLANWGTQWGQCTLLLGRVLGKIYEGT